MIVMFSLNTNLNKSFIFTYLQLVKEARKHLIEGGNGQMEIVIPEPNFTRLLQSIKNHHGVNMWTDNWGEFKENVEGVVVTIKCSSNRITNKKQLKRFKGENGL